VVHAEGWTKANEGVVVDPDGGCDLGDAAFRLCEVGTTMKDPCGDWWHSHSGDIRRINLTRVVLGDHHLIPCREKLGELLGVGETVFLGAVGASFGLVAPRTRRLGLAVGEGFLLGGEVPGFDFVGGFMGVWVRHY